MLLKFFSRFKLAHWLFCAMILLVSVVGIMLMCGPGNILAFNTEKVQHFNEGWSLADENGKPKQDEFITIPTTIESDEDVKIVKELPENLPDPSVISFRSAQQHVRVFCDDDLLYSFGYDKPLAIGKSPGSGWNIIRLPYNSAGRLLSIEFSSPYDSYNGLIPDIKIGSKAAQLFDILNGHILSLFLTLVIFIVGVVIVILYIFILSKDDKGGNETLYLGLFSLFASIWLFGECRLTQFFSIPPAVNTCIAFIAMLAIPIPLLKYIACSRSSSQKKMITFTSKVMSGFFIFSLLLQIFGICDFVPQLPMIHTVFIICSCVVLYAIITDIVHKRGRDNYRLLISVGIFVFSFLLETATIYLSFGSLGSMIRIGVILIIAVQAQVAFKNASQIVYMSRLATTDTLTGCLNRTSYNEYIKEIEGSKDIGIVIADINNLKYINDTFGHNIGDDAIIQCAKCFKKAFSSYGYCYRIGGDEFVMIGKYLTIEKLKVAHAAFQLQIKEYSKQVDYPFAISDGYAIYDLQNDLSFSEAMHNADEIMYQNKRRIKRGEEEI